MREPLSILGWGAITAAGLSAGQTCAATRASIMGFSETDFRYPSLEPAICAEAPFSPQPTKGHVFSRLVAMAVHALRECLDDADVSGSKAALLLGIREPFRAAADKSWSSDRLLTAIAQCLQVRFHPESAVVPNGNAATFDALLRARSLLATGKVEVCVVGGVDSFLNWQDLEFFRKAFRLKCEMIPQGFIPGEGAAFLAVTGPLAARGRSSRGEIVGLGLAKEDPAVTVLSDGHPTGKGMQRALQATIEDGGIQESRIQFRVSDLNGESYSAVESTFVTSRFYRTRRENPVVWLSSASVGEIGAASGALLVILAARGMEKGYAPGDLAMCEASSDSGLRAGCLVQSSPRPRSLRSQHGVRLKDTREPSAGLAIIPNIVAQHADNCSSLWSLREHVVGFPHFNLTELAEFDDRIEAHLDGLREVGHEGWEICKSSLNDQDAGGFFMAGVLAFESDDKERISDLINSSASRSDLLRAIISALGWLEYNRVSFFIEDFLKSDAAAIRRVGIAAAAIHRHHPGNPLRDALADPDGSLRARALKAVGQIGLSELLPYVNRCLTDKDEECRFSANWSATILGEARAIPVLLEMTSTISDYAGQATDLALRCLDVHSARSFVRDLEADPVRASLAVLGAGVIGDPASLPWLIDRMKVPKLARIAGEAFTMITGADISEQKLDGPKPHGYESGPSEDIADPNVEMDPDENLSWPDPFAVEQWWHSNRNRFQEGVRHLLGVPITVESLQNILRTGKQRQRAAAALELAIRQPGRPLFEVRAPGVRQQRMLC